MSDYSQDFSDNSPKKYRGLPQDENYSYSRISRKIYTLRRTGKVTLGEGYIALDLADYCHDKSTFPEFSISYAELAVRVFSKKQVVVGAIQKLIDLNVLSSIHSTTSTNRYKWNKQFLFTGILPVTFSDPQGSEFMTSRGQNFSPLGVRKNDPIYIEFILKNIYILYKDYFAQHDKKIAHRVPAPAKKRGEPRGIGSVNYLSRREAWEKAINEVAEEHFEKNPHQNIYTQIYLTLMGGFNIEKVNHPKSYLKKIKNDHVRIYESKKNSGFPEHLEDDSSFLEFIKTVNERMLQ